jgi:hypothetical protein
MQSFGCEMAETQLLPDPGTKLEKLFVDMNIATTVMFTVELLLNIFAHSANRFHEFVNKSTNLFDVFVVVASLLNAILSATGITIPGAKVFRVRKGTKKAQFGRKTAVLLICC